MKHDDLLKIMGADLGISRYRNESDESFGIRTVYSASRFWIEAFCLDDGRMGADGCQPGIISRRLNLWLDRISSIYPFIGQWIRSQRHYTPFSKLLSTTDSSWSVTSSPRTTAEHTDVLPVIRFKSAMTCKRSWASTIRQATTHPCRFRE